MTLTPLVQTRQLGKLRIHAIQAGGQKLDGGAMFGIVPKPLWERRIPADDRNRIQLGMRCLLVEHDAGLLLIDTGVGNKDDAKFRDIYGIDNIGAAGGTQLEDGLKQLGYTTDDVKIVVNTHLHFDHAGGNTRRAESGEVFPTFAKARYYVQRGEYDFATHTTERTAGSYLQQNYVPVEAAGRFQYLNGEQEVVPGVRVIPTPGHTPCHQGILIESDGEKLFYLADLIPTSAHLPLAWIMGYDLEPMVTLETKRGILNRAADESWLLVFEHDANVAWGHLARDGKSFALKD